MHGRLSPTRNSFTEDDLGFEACWLLLAAAAAPPRHRHTQDQQRCIRPGEADLWIGAIRESPSSRIGCEQPARTSLSNVAPRIQRGLPHIDLGSDPGKQDPAACAPLHTHKSTHASAVRQ